MSGPLGMTQPRSCTTSSTLKRSSNAIADDQQRRVPDELREPLGAAVVQQERGVRDHAVDARGANLAAAAAAAALRALVDHVHGNAHLAADGPDARTPRGQRGLRQ